MDLHKRRCNRYPERGSITADYDNPKLTTHSVSEPASPFLLCFGLAALALTARFRN